ncbi:hypothetical protein HYT54_00170 [Candidatus Woesearchaeota archaeon]|nr:hypothetical protein [Candidatus Woesearchaeota archaeon]
MALVMDAMVAIHLAKITLLEKSCEHFDNIIIPALVYEEIMEGSKKGFPEVGIINAIIANRKLQKKTITRKNLIEKINQFSIYGGEAEAIALYWQEKAEYIATDDDNVRKKKALLDINVMGTPAIILKLYRNKAISKEKCLSAISELRKIGWFSSAILDKLLMEV